ncbi:MAG: DUF1540 domain-containing protein [Tissierella sp.]|uniref:DUF1540 domain-containing protein n=1 Tax=Tissierella sp. TaxID=41274 RepID=UPI003F9A73A3
MDTKNDIIEGVNCVVDNCFYYNEGDKCGAGIIEIAPKDANTSEETDCNTFKSIENMN